MNWLDAPGWIWWVPWLPLAGAALFWCLPGGARAWRDAAGLALAEDSSAQEDEQSQVALMQDLRQSLARGGAGLSLLYQPKMDATGGHFAGVEALLRWQHPVLGRVSPAVFLPLAAQSGLLVPLGHWVLNEACRQMAEWQSQGWRIGVAVNVSSAQWSQPDLHQRLSDCLLAHHTRAGQLTLELGDSHASDDGREVPGVLQRLSTLGVRIALDDLKAARPAPWALGHWPADEVKLDCQAVSEVRPDHPVRATIKQAHAAGLRVVAVGVETPAQEAALKALGCDQLQGYLYAKAMPGRHLVMWLREGLLEGSSRLSPASLTALEPSPDTEPEAFLQ